MDWMGIHWVGINAENGQKLLLTIGLVILAFALSSGGKALLNALTDPDGKANRRFWSRQALALIVAVLTVFGLLSIWLDNPARLTSAMGLATAGIAFALQKVITSFAGYLVILRGNTFTIGDRITMGGVRGDVAALGFMQTTIMEMGQPPSVQSADPAMWVHSRQFTGRIVTVANNRIFDEPVYNYTREFPYIWEEIIVPVGYRGDHAKAEQILLAIARKHAVPGEESPTTCRAADPRALLDRYRGRRAARVLSPDRQLGRAERALPGEDARRTQREGPHVARAAAPARRRRHRGGLEHVRHRRLPASPGAARRRG